MTRVVTGKLVSSDTTAITGINVVFRPLAVYAYTSESAAISLDPVSIITDINGRFSITLYDSEDIDSNKSSFIYDTMGYRIEIPDLGMARIVRVPAGSTSIDWSDLTDGIN